MPAQATNVWAALLSILINGTKTRICIHFAWMTCSASLWSNVTTQPVWSTVTTQTVWSTVTTQPVWSTVTTQPVSSTVTTQAVHFVGSVVWILETWAIQGLSWNYQCIKLHHEYLERNKWLKAVTDWPQIGRTFVKLIIFLLLCRMSWGFCGLIDRALKWTFFKVWKKKLFIIFSSVFPKKIWVVISEIYSKSCIMDTIYTRYLNCTPSQF